MKTQPWYCQLAAIGLSIVSGALLALSLPPYNLSYLGWVTFLPLLLATRLTRTTLSLLCGVLMAGTAIVILGGPCRTPVQCANALFLGLSLSLTLGLTAGMLSFASRRMTLAAWTIFVPCAAVVVELISSSYAPVGVPLSQHSNLFCLWLAAYTGTWAVTFLLWLVPALLIALLKDTKSLRYRSAAVLILIAVVIALPIHHPTGAATLQVAAIQAPDSYSATEQTQKIAKKAEVAVWPEQLLDSSSAEPAKAAKLCKLCIVSNHIEQPRTGKPFNTARVTDPDGTNLGFIKKHHLFGNEINLYQHGGFSKPLNCGNFHAGLAICYDATFPDVSRHLALNGADVIFIPCGDPELPNSLFEHLHSAHVAFRAAETGTPIVWADGNSLSAIFDSNGSEVARAKPHAIDAITGTVHLRQGTTFYTRAGDYFAYLCTLFALILLLVTFINRKRSKAAAV